MLDILERNLTIDATASPDGKGGILIKISLNLRNQNFPDGGWNSMDVPYAFEMCSTEITVPHLMFLQKPKPKG